MKKADDDLNTNPETEQPSLDERLRREILAGASALGGTGIPEKIAEAASFIRRTVDLEKIEEAASAIRRTINPEEIKEAARACRRRYARQNPPPQLVPRRDMIERVAPNPAAAKPVGDHSDNRKSKPRTIYQGAQSIRAHEVLKRLFPPDGIPPCREELANADLLDQFGRAYDAVEGRQNPRSRYPKPCDNTVLRRCGRK